MNKCFNKCLMYSMLSHCRKRFLGFSAIKSTMHRRGSGVAAFPVWKQVKEGKSISIPCKTLCGHFWTHDVDNLRIIESFWKLLWWFWHTLILVLCIKITCTNYSESLKYLFIQAVVLKCPLKCLSATLLFQYNKPSEMVVPDIVNGLQDNLDVVVSLAERHYYNCDFKMCYSLTSM